MTFARPTVPDRPQCRTGTDPADEATADLRTGTVRTLDEALYFTEPHSHN